MSEPNKESNSNETSRPQPKPPEITLNKPLYETFSKDTSSNEKREK